MNSLELDILDNSNISKISLGKKGLLLIERGSGKLKLDVHDSSDSAHVKNFSVISNSPNDADKSVPQNSV